MGKPRGYKRRRVIIKTIFQFKLLAVVLFIMLLMMVDVHFSVSIIRNVVGESLASSLVSRLNQMMYMKIIVLLVVIVSLVMLVSHRIAGPLYRFEKSLEALKEGDLTHRIRLRKGDELLDLAQVFNTVIEDLHNRLKKDRTRREEIVQSIADIKSAISTSVLTEELKGKFKEQLDAVEGKIREINNEFTI